MVWGRLDEGGTDACSELKWTGVLEMRGVEDWGGFWAVGGGAKTDEDWENWLAFGTDENEGCGWEENRGCEEGNDGVFVGGIEGKDEEPILEGGGAKLFRGGGLDDWKEGVRGLVIEGLRVCMLVGTGAGVNGLLPVGGNCWFTGGAKTLEAGVGGWWCGSCWVTGFE